MSRLIIGPFNRVEGDLEVKLDIAEGAVREAWVTSPLYRGFERILVDKKPLDALVYAPRICGICSVAQSVAAAEALRFLQGLTRLANGELLINLMLATENIADHLAHFYLFFMPDFAAPVYRAEPWFEPVARRFTALRGEAAREALTARAQLLHVLGLLAGKWPHSLAIQPGGSTRAIDKREQARLAGLLAAFRRFLETRLFGDALEAMAALRSEAELDVWASRHAPERSDFASFLTVSGALGLDRLGRGPGRFLSHGGYGFEGGSLFARGVFADGAASPFDPAGIHEDVSHVWPLEEQGATPSPDGLTDSDAHAGAGYTWCKAPRLQGRTFEVGAFARQMVDGQPLIRDLAARHGGGARTRVIARLIEIARVVPAMESWVRALRPSEPCCSHGAPVTDGQGFGLIEAARGSLGHWLRIADGRIAAYDIIAPTTWNFSPRDQAGAPGPVEQALVGAPVREGERAPIAAQHVVRSFDPCMSCTVH